jgi:hypothetical protein
MENANAPLPILRGLEFSEAGGRLMSQKGQFGDAKSCALAWVLAFAQEDLAALMEQELKERVEEVRRFGFDAGLGEAIPQGDSETRLLFNVSLNTSYGLDPLGMLSDAQREVRVRIDAYLRGETVGLTDRRVTYEVTRTTKDSRSGRILLHLHETTDGVVLHLLHLLAELGSRIKACKRCRKIFLAGRTDKQFCSGSCQAMTWKKDHLSEAKKSLYRKKGKGRKKAC